MAVLLGSLDLFLLKSWWALRRWPRIAVLLYRLHGRCSSVLGWYLVWVAPPLRRLWWWYWGDDLKLFRLYYLYLWLGLTRRSPLRVLWALGNAIYVVVRSPFRKVLARWI